MHSALLKQASLTDPALTVNIITHSALGRYVLQIRTAGSNPQLLVDRRGAPRYWSELGQMRRDLRAWGFTAVPLTVVVPQDEVIGRI